MGRHPALWALVISLSLHALVLAFMAYRPLEGPAETKQFVELDFLEEPLALEQEFQTMEERLAASIAQRVANLKSDRNAATSSEERSSATGQNAANLAAEVEAELRAFEAAEAARLAAEAKDFGLDKIPEVDDRSVDTFSDWDKRFEGEVTVTYDCDGRTPFRLDVPGYRCKGGGTVEVEVAVDRDGNVVESWVALGAGAPCLEEEAMKSAGRSKFGLKPSAPKRQTCTIRYVFVPQE